MSRHVRPLTRKQQVAAVAAAITTFAVLAIGGEWFSQLPKRVQELYQEEVRQEFPGEIEVSYGSFQATTAMFPSGMPQITPAESDVNWTPWALDNDGVLAWRSVISISLSGRDTTPIYVDDVRLVDRSCEEPPMGLYMPPGGAGDTADRWMSMNFDDSRPEWQLSSDSSTDGDWEFPVWVSASEQEVISVMLETWNQDCTWALELVYRVGGESRIHRMGQDDIGRPFRLVGPKNATSILTMPYGAPSAYTIEDAIPVKP